MGSNPFNFFSERKWLTVAVIGSFFIWKLMSSAYDNVVDPFIKRAIPANKFNFLNSHVSGMVKYDQKRRMEPPISFNIGTFIRELLICSLIIIILFIIAKQLN